MSNEPISSPEEADTAWLTAVLREAGALARGTVIGVERSTLDGNWSSNAYLNLRYSVKATGECPERLFIKTCSGFGPSEFHYYTRDYVDVNAVPLPRCFHAAYDESRRRYHLLLDDVSTTHELILHAVPNLTYAQALADGFGAMHARWWGSTRFSQIGESMPTIRDVHRFTDTARPGIAHLQQHYRSEIGATDLETINRYFGEHPLALAERLSDERGFCLIHGDANPTNVFVPRSGAGEPIYVIDRQPFESSLTTFLGVYDISHAIAHRWEREHRLQLELAMLRRYHQRLVENGISDYRWNQLVDDYVLCVGMGIYDAVGRSAHGPNETLKWLWLPMLKKSIQALKDTEDRRRFLVGGR